MQTQAITPKTPITNVLSFPQAMLAVAPTVPEMEPVLRSASRVAPVVPAADARLHDARNALASLYLLSGLLREPGVLSAAHGQYADDLDAITRMLGKLLGGEAETLSSRGARTVRARTAGEAVKNCIRMLQAAAGERVSVFVSAESHLPALRLEDDALARMLLNLVKNAAEAMPQGGSVTITARRALGRTAKAVLIHVSDDGPGIPSFALGRIFEPGFSGKRQPNAAEPCGLGLAIVRELAERSGGAVRVASTRRRGTTFELRLPCLLDADGTALP